MKRLIILLILPLACLGQELVPDPGFEALEYCPVGISMLNNSVFWQTPSQGTPDLFNSCGGKGSTVGVPNNLCGKQKPVEGNGYGGLILFEYQYWDYKEYLQTELLMPLVKGAIYRLSFHITLADNSMFAVDKIQAAFTGEPFYFKKHSSLVEIIPDITFTGTNDGYFLEKKKWILLSYDYTARGNERYLTIGNFIHDRYGKRKQVKKSSDVPSAYYFLDAISVKEIQPSPLSEEEQKQVDIEVPVDTLQPGSSFRLQNILFETDKDVLLPQSHIELEKVIRILIKYPLMELEIQGHTDDQASEEHNFDLSDRRAIAVRKYLIAKGIAAHRLTTKGYGESRPVTDNSTEEGRALNRRVEFYINKR